MRAFAATMESMPDLQKGKIISGSPMAASSSKDGAVSSEDSRGMGPRRSSISSMGAQVSQVFLERMADYNKPEAHFVDRVTFNAFIGICVALSTVLLGIEMDHDLGLLGQLLAIVFALIWIAEMCFRIRAHGFWGYIRDPANKLDFCLVWVAIVDAMVGIVGEDMSKGQNLRMVTSLRVLRLLRVARILRILTFFRELWLLVKGMFDALPVLSWVVIMITLELYMGSLVTTSLVGHECDTKYVDWNECFEYFGTVPQSMFTLFQIMTLDSWAIPVAKPVLKESPWMIVFFVIFLYGTTFGSMNLVVGVLVDHIVKATHEDARKIEKAAELRQKMEIAALEKIFEQADYSHNGLLDLQEFTHACQRREVQDIFDSIDIPVGRPRLARRIFEVLDADNSGEMSVDTFINRVKQLKHEGKGLHRDQTLLLMEVRHLYRRLEKLHRFVNPDEPCLRQISPGDFGDESAAVAAGLRPSSTPKPLDLTEEIADSAPTQGFEVRLEAMESRLAKLIGEGLGSLSDRMQVVEEKIARVEANTSSSRGPGANIAGVHVGARNTTSWPPAQEVEAGASGPSSSRQGSRNLPGNTMVCCQPKRAPTHVLKPLEDT